MKGSIVLKKKIATQDKALAHALDQIPLMGEVTEDHYRAYVGLLRKSFDYEKGYNGLGVASRFLCMKRPDYFLCVNDENREPLAKDIGIPVRRITLDSYWEVVVKRLIQTPWRDAKEPSVPEERQAWQGRVALLDAIYYTKE